MPMVADTAKWLRIKAHSQCLTTAERARLIADVLDAGEFNIAEALAHDLVKALRVRRCRPRTARKEP